MKHSKTLKLRKALKDQMLTCIDDVYYGRAPSSATKPYAVFVVEENFTRDGCAVCTIIIDIADYGTDDTVIEQLADDIQEAFDHFHYLDISMSFTTYLDSRKPIPEDDKLILRRRIEFELRVYGG